MRITNTALRSVLVLFKFFKRIQTTGIKTYYNQMNCKFIAITTTEDEENMTFTFLLSFKATRRASICKEMKQNSSWYNQVLAIIVSKRPRKDLGLLDLKSLVHKVNIQAVEAARKISETLEQTTILA